MKQMLLGLVLGVALSVQGVVVNWSGNGHAYEAVAVSNGITWAEAQADCEVRGGYLATSASEAENGFIYSLVQDASYWSGVNGPWLGGLQPAGSPEPDGNWQWVSGESWGFEAWSLNEPNNGGGTEDRVQFWQNSSAWNDKPAGQTAFGYVAEYQIYSGATGALQVAIGGGDRAVAGSPLDLTGIIDGVATLLIWDFDGGSPVTNRHFLSHTWNVPGDYDVVLAAFNETYPGGVSATQTIHVLTLEESAIHVSPSGDDANDGSNWASAMATIQAGVDAQLLEQGLVLVDDGTYLVTNEIVVGKNITLKSRNGSDATIVDGGGSNRCFNLGSSACTLGGFTITNGYAVADGGGVSCDTTAPVITNCIVIGCSAGDEGGGVNRGSLFGCTLRNNLALSHGGGLNNGIAYGCTFSSNTASNNGGGAEWSDLFDSRIEYNEAGQHGGGLKNGTAIGCVISNNTAAVNGGGMHTVVATNCVVCSNSAEDSGGGMYLGEADSCQLFGNRALTGGGARATALTNCDVFGNDASGSGGGVFGSASVLVGCNVYSNAAVNNGGGVQAAYVHESVIHGNEALGSGGGGVGARFYNCLVYGNEAGTWGGGMSDCLSINCTVVGNAAGLGGGGQSFGSGVSWESRNCIIYNNFASRAGESDLYVNTSHTVPAIYSSCNLALVHGVDGNITNAPQLASLSHLSPDSPCIGMGIYTNATGTDIDGEPWLNPPSMGCDEYYGVGSVSGSLEVAIVGNTNVLVGYPLGLMADIQGALYRSEWDFGDGAMETNNPLPAHTWSVPGSYDVVLTAYSDSSPGGLSSTQTIQVLSVEEAVIHVSPFGDDANDGSSWATAKATIQAGVDAQSYDHGLVLVSNGTYAVTNEIMVNKTITVQGVGGPEATIVDGGGGNRCFNLGSSSCMLGGFTITNGYGAMDGGGIFCSGTTPVITNCIVTGNTSGDEGGGVNNGTLLDCEIGENVASTHGGGLNNGIAYDCVFSSNTALNYGGGAAEGSDLYRCVVVGNEAGHGGGVINGTAVECIFSNNVATVSGGGCKNGKISDCEVIENRSDNYGGGVAGTTVHGCRIAGNESKNSGGGCSGSYIYNSIVAFNRTGSWGGGMNDCFSANCTIVGNQASHGGGLSFGTNAKWEAHNTIVRNNSANVLGEEDIRIPSNRAVPAVYSSCSPDLFHGVDGNITNAPMLVSVSHLAPGSPCIGMGVYTNTSGTDIDGQAWLNPPSMGCDEYHGAGSVTGVLEVAVDCNTNVMVGYPIDLVVDIRGALYRSEWDFGDGTMATNKPLLSHVWDVPGLYDVALTAYSDSYPGGVSATQTIQVLSLEEAAIHVSPSGDDANDGSSWASAMATIQAGVDAQQYEHGLVLVDDGTYLVTNEIVVGKTVVVQSRNGTETTLIDGGGTKRCFNLGSSSCILSGLTITNGYAEFDGGGVWGSSTDPVLTNCIVAGNLAGDDGGGAHKCTLLDCSVVDNVASNRGGGSCWSTLSNCVVSGNWSDNYGGGLYDCTATDSAINGNYSDRSGGGMRNGTAFDCVLSENTALETGGGMQSSTLYDCLVSGNQTLLYGGGGVQGGASRVYGCVITGNIAKTVGGGGASGAQLFNCLIMDNESTDRGGGLNDCKAVNCTIMGNRSNLGGGVSFGTNPDRTMHNSIIYGNSASTSSTDIYMYNRTEAGTFDSCSPDLEHGVDGNITDAPMLLSSGHLLPNSPCIGAGSYSNAVGTDIDGEAWLNPPSMGCDEYPGEGNVVGELAVDLAEGPQTVEGVNLGVDGMVEGPVSLLVWDFGDGSFSTNRMDMSHTWGSPGTYNVILTAYNDSYPSGVAATQTITVVSWEESTIHVAPTGNDANDGSDWANAKATLQAGVDAQAYYGGTVLVSNGTYLVEAEVLVTNPIHLTSQNGPSGTVVVGGGTNRCFNLGGAECTVSGFTVSEGFSSGHGGGIYCDNTVPAISNCLVTGCSSLNHGGGIKGGTVYNSELSYNNTSKNGAGAYSSILYNCALHQNHAVSRGGGAENCSLYNCTVTQNRALNGGGLYFYNSGNAVRNSIVSGNIASGLFKDVGMSGNNASFGIAHSCSPDLPHGVDGNITNAPGLVSHIYLSPLSPCRGSGDAAYAVGVDMDGELWIDPPSMGCDEYHGLGTVNGSLEVAINCYSNAVVGDHIYLLTDIDGGTTMNVWDFGDGTVATNLPLVAHAWDAPGLYDVVLTAYNGSWTDGVSATHTVRVVGVEELVHWGTSGHYYQPVCVPGKITWKEAHAEAVRRGGYLATSNTEEEDTFIFSLVQGTNCWNGNLGPWLGGFQPVGSPETDGNWQWVDGEAMTYSGWSPGEPNDNNGGQNRVCFWGYWPRWDDNNDTGKSYGYVVEYQLHPAATGSLSVAIGGESQVVAGAPLKLLGMLDGVASELVWDFADGHSATNVQLATHVWTTPGDYDVNLTAYNADHPGGIAASKTIRVLALQDATVHVAVDGDDADDGSNWALAKRTILGGVDAAVEGGLVLVSNGTYMVSSEIVVHKNITVQSIGGADETFVDGGGSNRCFVLGSEDSSMLSGLTLTHGFSTNSGGAVLSLDTSHIISNCVIENCVSELFGGGVTRGTLYRCRVQDNSSSYRAGGANGAVLYSSLVRGNSAANNSGGLQGCDAYNCTIVSNRAGWNAGGVNNCKLRNSIVIGNTANNDGDNLYGANTYLTNSCSPDVMSGVSGNTSGDPLFANAASGDYQLMPGSPCINWGANGYVTNAVDLAGNPRIVEDYVDIGCYEYQGTIGKADSDDDGLLDEWERRWFGGNARPDLDGDGDGHDNTAEQLAGTVPTNQASCVTVGVTPVDSGGPSHFIIDWEAASNRIYSILWSPSLVDSFQTIAEGIEYPQNSYTDTVHSAESSGYYRVVVRVPGEDDLDGDGLPNGWEEAHFGLTTGASASGDDDGDGFDNYSEYVAGSDPTNAASKFTVDCTPVQDGANSHFVVEWAAYPNRSYTVLWTPALGQGFQVLASGIDYPVNSYTDTAHSAESSGFYRVVVQVGLAGGSPGGSLPGWWQQEYFSVTTGVDPAGDADADGLGNLGEYIAGTDPTNGTSFFASDSSLAEVGGTNCFVVEWISIPDRLYSVQWSSNLADGFLPLAEGIEHPLNSYTDTVHAAEAGGFYKVDVQLK